MQQEPLAELAWLKVEWEDPVLEEHPVASVLKVPQELRVALVVQVALGLLGREA